MLEPGYDSIDIIIEVLEERGLKDKDLIGIIGDKTTISKVLRRKRNLTLRMIRNLHAALNIPYSLLMKVNRQTKEDCL